MPPRPAAMPSLPLIRLLVCCILAPVGAQAQAASAAGPSPVKLSGYIQAREVYQNQIGLTSSINRARLAASGSVMEAVTWRIQGEFRTG